MLGSNYRPGAMGSDAGARSKPTLCPVCGARVYFVRPAHGGMVWFDELGWPWPKHPCMDAETSPEQTWAAVRLYLSRWENVPSAQRPAGLNIFHARHKKLIRGCDECGAEAAAATPNPTGGRRGRGTRTRRKERRLPVAHRSAHPASGVERGRTAELRDRLERLRKAAEDGELNSLH